MDGFQLFERARPVRPEEAGESTVGEDFAGGLAFRAVVRFVIGVANAQDFFAAHGARQSVAAVYGHVFAECGDLFGEAGIRFGFEALHPEFESGACGFEQPLPILRT